MEKIISAYDPETRTVTVTFAAGEVTHERKVNACHDENGEYDEEATEERIDAVARGVAVKIGLGVIRKAEPEPELPAVEVPAIDTPAEPEPAAE